MDWGIVRGFRGTALCMLLAFSGVSWGFDYGRASKIESSRQGDVVVRYIKEYGSPCLRVQVLEPAKNWALIAEKRFCSYREKSLITDVAYATFEKITFSPDGISFRLSITPLTLNDEELYVCTIPVSGAKIRELECIDKEK